MKFTIDGLLTEIKRFAEDQNKLMNDILRTIDNVEDRPDPQRRILDSAIYMAVGKLKYDNINSLLNDISDLAQTRVEALRNEKNSQDEG